MANFTTNYNLKKPIDDEFFDIEDFNGNVELIDSAIKGNADSIALNASDRASGDAALQAQIDGLSFNQLVLKSQTIDTGVSLGDCVKNDGTKWVKTISPEGIYIGNNSVVICGFTTLTGFSLEAPYTYFAQIDGSIGLGVTKYPVGKAVDVNQLIVDFNPGITYPKAYTEDMIKFYAMPGESGTIRLKIQKPENADGVKIYRSNTAFAGGDIDTWGNLVVDITDDTGYDGENEWCVDSGLSDGTIYYYKAVPYVGDVGNLAVGSNESKGIAAGGLSHEYDFSDVVGSTVNDMVGSNNGTLSGATIEDGLIGDCINGTGAGVLTLNNEVDMRGGMLTFWFKSNGNECSGLFGNEDSRSYNWAGGFSGLDCTNISLDDNSIVVGQWYQGMKEQEPIAIGTWVFVTVYYDTQRMGLSINRGTVEWTDTIPSGGSHQGYLKYMGQSGNELYLNDRELNGQIDNIRLWSRQLSSDELDAVYEERQVA